MNRTKLHFSSSNSLVHAVRRVSTWCCYVTCAWISWSGIWQLLYLTGYSLAVCFLSPILVFEPRLRRGNLPVILGAAGVPLLHTLTAYVFYTSRHGCQWVCRMFCMYFYFTFHLFSRTCPFQCYACDILRYECSENVFVANIPNHLFYFSKPLLRLNIRKSFGFFS